MAEPKWNVPAGWTEPTTWTSIECPCGSQAHLLIPTDGLKDSPAFKMVCRCGRETHVHPEIPPTLREWKEMLNPFVPVYNDRGLFVLDRNLCKIPDGLVFIFTHTPPPCSAPPPLEYSVEIAGVEACAIFWRFPRALQYARWLKDHEEAT